MAATPFNAGWSRARPCAPPHKRSPAGQGGARFIPWSSQTEDSTADQNGQRLDGVPRILRTHWWRGDYEPAPREVWS
jgi:hypothetical protein